MPRTAFAADGDFTLSSAFGILRSRVAVEQFRGHIARVYTEAHEHIGGQLARIVRCASYPVWREIWTISLRVEKSSAVT